MLKVKCVLKSFARLGHGCPPPPSLNTTQNQICDQEIYCIKQDCLLDLLNFNFVSSFMM